MIRVLVRATSLAAKAGLERLLRENPALLPLDEFSGGAPGVDVEFTPDVLLVETATLADPAARQAMDWANAGGPAVLLVHNPALEPVAKALGAGVKAVLPSRAAGPELRAAIEAAAAGLVVLDASGVETLLHGPAASSPANSEEMVEALTPRETEVLGLLAAGLGNKEIASRLGISEHTVKFHVASIMGKVGASSRTEAVTLGIRRGLIMI